MALRKSSSTHDSRSSKTGSTSSKAWRASHQPGRAINPIGYELDSELDITDLNIGMSQVELEKYDKILSQKEIEILGLSAMEIEAKKRGQQWRNLSYIFFKNYHNLTFSDLQSR